MSEQPINALQVLATEWQGSKQINIASRCFNEDSKLTFDRETRKIEVETTLREGFVEGGQRVRMVLSTPTVVPIVPDSETIGYL